MEYLLNEEQLVTDYLFVNEPHEKFSMYFEDGFPIFKVPEGSDRPYFLFEMKSPGRMIKFFCPERHKNLDTAVWYFYVEVLDEKGVAHGLPDRSESACATSGPSLQKVNRNLSRSWKTSP